MKTWFIADTHFGHEAVMQYEERPFISVEHMDAALISNWNNTVADEDVIWHLGDVALVPKPRIIEILAQLKGRKYLICGNHDRRITCTWWQQHGFETAVKFPGIVDLGHMVLSHIPVPGVKKLNIHGHLHGNRHRIMPDGHPDLYYCVSVEQTGFRPVSFEEITAQTALRWD